MLPRNAIRQDRLRAGAVECPLCRRQIADPARHLVVYGPADPTVENADAVECPRCSGVTFVVEGSPDDDGEPDGRPR